MGATAKLAQRWTWSNKGNPSELVRRKDSIIKVEELVLLNDPPLDFDKIRQSDVCLITGDGDTLADDVEKFESWKIPHDLYCVNRSLKFFKRPVNHWCAVDYEECMWFAENVTKAVQGKHPIHRHTIGIFPQAFDVYWQQAVEFQNEIQKRIWIGNSGYFAMLTALHMGYKKLVLAGCPMNNNSHWYEPDNEFGPNWHGEAFTQWIDFKMRNP